MDCYHGTNIWVCLFCEIHSLCLDLWCWHKFFSDVQLADFSFQLMTSNSSVYRPLEDFCLLQALYQGCCKFILPRLDKVLVSPEINIPQLLIKTSVKKIWRVRLRINNFHWTGIKGNRIWCNILYFLFLFDFWLLIESLDNVFALLSTLLKLCLFFFSHHLLFNMKFFVDLTHLCVEHFLLTY